MYLTDMSGATGLQGPQGVKGDKGDTGATEADKVAGNAGTEVVAESQGYLVDVYPNGIHLRGRDFVAEEYLPIASYWIDISLQTIEANTFTDSTGIIIT